MLDKVLITKIITKKMDFTKKYDPDTGSYFHMDFTTGRFQLNKNTLYYSKMALRFNLVELFDNYFHLGLSANRKYFFDYSFPESENVKLNVDSKWSA